MKNFSIFKNKNKKPEDKTPDYKMSVKVGEEYVECGGCWLREDKSGGKYFSCKLSDVYVDHTKGVARKGWEMVAEGGEAPQKEEDSSQIPF